MGYGANVLRINVSNYWILASICYTKKNLEILILGERLGFNQTKAKRTLELSLAGSEQMPFNWLNHFWLKKAEHSIRLLASKQWA